MGVKRMVKDGLPITYITDEKYEYSFAYFNSNKWLDRDRVVLHRGNGASNRGGSLGAGSTLVLVDLRDGNEEVLISGEGINHSSFLVHENKLYFSHGADLHVMDLNTRERRQLMEGNGNFVCKLQITNDGKYLNYHHCNIGAQKMSQCYRVNAETGETELLFEKNFAPPFVEANHHMMCPTDKDTVFFAHEGVTFYVSNRLWLWNKDKGMHRLAKQEMDEEGNLADCFGHETWAPDGKGLYFVKYACSPKPPRGICYVDVEGNQTGVLYGKYPYWHVSVSPDGRYLASDTQSIAYSGVCMVDTETREEKLLVKADTTWHHPSHPHPCFNIASDRLCFHDLIDDKVCVGVIDLEDTKNFCLEP